MTIILKPETEQYLKQQAKQHGCDDPSQYIEQLLERDRHQACKPTKEREETVDEWLDRIAGSATSGLTTDQIMEMTRSEV